MPVANEPGPTEVQRPTLPLWHLALTAVFIVLGCFAVYQSTQVRDLNRAMAANQKEIAALKTSFASLESDLRNQFASLRDDMGSVEKESLQKVADAQTAATRHAETAVRKLEKKQADTTAALDAQLTEVKESTERNSHQIAGISNDFSAVRNDVSTVRTDVAASRTDLDRSIADLQRIRGDMGEMSGLIATNSKEIQLLRQLGDRNIYEFTLSKSAGLSKVGDIRLRLNKVDQHRNRYSVTVNAGELTIEKKDKTTNEPVQFYVSEKARQPYEVVVNEVGKNTVKGYLATPKVTTARN